MIDILITIDREAESEKREDHNSYWAWITHHNSIDSIIWSISFWSEYNTDKKIERNDILNLITYNLTIRIYFLN